MTDGVRIAVRWRDLERSFAPGQDVTIGRDPASDVQVDSPHVSRAHAILRHDGTQWRLIDTGSTQGTFLEGDKVTSVIVDGRLDLVLGQPHRGERLTVEVAATTRNDEGTIATSAPPPGASARPAFDDGTIAATPAGGPARPGGDLRAEALDGGTVVTGDDLMVECAGRSYRFERGREAVIGRDAGADLVSANPTVSRRHARVHHDGTLWWLEDLGSTGGSYVDGRRMGRVPLQGSTAVWLGDAETGERLVFVASGSRKTTLAGRLRRSARSGTGLVAVGAAALLAVVAVAVLGTMGDSDGPSADRLAKASVLLLTDEASGSGTVVDAEQGLILTNAHVVSPRAAGMGVQADVASNELRTPTREITIAVAPDLDHAAEIRYRGEVVAVDGYLDLAVVKITKLASGALIEDRDLDGLVGVDLGDSDDLKSGDRIRVLGYPGVSESDTPDLKQGVLGGRIRDERLASNAGYLNIDADTNPGNSGGGVFDDEGRLVGVPTLLYLEYATLSKSNRIRPINFAKPLIDAARNGETYESRFIWPLGGQEKVFEVAPYISRDTGQSFVNECVGRPYRPAAGDDVVSIAFEYEGFQTSDHQDLQVRVFDGRVSAASLIGRSVTNDEYPFAVGGSGCITAFIPFVDPGTGGRATLSSGTYVVQILAGPNYEVLWEGDLTIDGPGGT